MKRATQAIISMILAVAMLITSTFTVAAARGDEEYICELRLIYADDYSEARDILDDSDFYDYELLDENLNEGSGEIGVWLAYKTTTNIEEAITDMTVMQMKGGYREGNYQEMIKQSRNEYNEVAKIYVKAIKYWKQAYNAGDFLAKSAFRQLNFYSVTDAKSSYNGMRMGDIFYKGIDTIELSTMFLEGNRYALNNIRSLIAMGVSYNADGKHYLEKVAEEAKFMQSNSGAYDEYNYAELVDLVAPTIQSLGQTFEELEIYEPEMNYYDDIITDMEIEHAEDKSMADRLRDVEYLNDETLYDFCLSYANRNAAKADGEEREEWDNTTFYPLIAALNEGQLAMTKVVHYYDVIRYSMSDYPEEQILDELESMEQIYSDTPFDIYTGVDRSIYDGTFALTNEAYRMETSTDKSLMEFLKHDEAALFASGLGAGTAGIVVSIWAICRTVSAQKAAVTAAQAKSLAVTAAATAKQNAVDAATAWLSSPASSSITQSLTGAYGTTYSEIVDGMISTYYTGSLDMSVEPFNVKIHALLGRSYKMSLGDKAALQQISTDYNTNMSSPLANADKGLQQAQDATVASSSFDSGAIFTGALYILGGALMLYSAISIGIAIYNYYHPDYDDIPTAMVDVVETVDGDRYIKYDVVYEAEAKDDGEYAAADLNAFGGQRWNALYYTKSYEAGKPLLAEFDLSYSNNTPDKGYAPVRRFGEVVCYNLNKYHFNSEGESIYLSVRQSEKQKAAVADVPQVVGSIFSAGWVLLAGGIGVLAGIGGTVGTQFLGNKKKSKEKTEKDS